MRAADTRLTQKVGAAVLVVMILAVGYLLFLRDRMFLGPSVTVRVYFEHVSSLKEGSAVLVAGRQVGQIVSINLVAADSAEATEMLGGQPGAVAVVRIDDSQRHLVPINGDFFVTSRGMLSERYLEIGAPQGDAEVGRPIEGGDQVRAADPPSMDRVLQNTWNNLTIARAFLEEVKPEAAALFVEVDRLSVTLAELEPAPGEYARLRAHVDQVAIEARTTWLSIQIGGVEPDQIAALQQRVRRTMTEIGLATTLLRLELAELGASFDRVSARIEAARPGLEQKIRAALAAADTALAKLERINAKVADLLGMIERGEGTIGRLQNDPEFPEDAKEVGKILKRNPWRVMGHPQDDEPNLVP